MKGVFILALLAILAAPIAASAGWVSEGTDPFNWPYHPNGGLGTYYDGQNNSGPVIAMPTTMPVNNQQIQAAGAAIYSMGGQGSSVYWEYFDGVSTYTKTYFGNREAHLSKYALGGTPGTGTWTSALGSDDTLIDNTPANPRLWYYQAVGLCGFNNGQNDRTPDETLHSLGTGGPAAGAVADIDGDHNVELVWWGGYPRWGNPGDAYDPDTNYWSKITTAPNFEGGRGAQVGSKFYWINHYKIGLPPDEEYFDSYWVLDLGDPASWAAATEMTWVEAIENYSVGWRSPGGSDVLITRTGVTYNYQDMTAKTVTAFTNNPDIGASPEMVVWHDWLVVIQESDRGSGTVWAYDLTQGAGGTWTDTGVACPSTEDGSSATVYMNTVFWTVQGRAAADAGVLFSITTTDLGLSRTLGDIDDNNVVDGLDLTAVLTAWDTVPGDALWNPRADLDNNQIIDGLDLTEVISNWTPTAAASPEPAKPGKRLGNVRKK